MPLRIKLLISVVAVELLRCLGGWINSCQISDWYAALNKPVGNLPYQTFASALNPRQAVDLQKGSADQVPEALPYRQAHFLPIPIVTG